MASIEYRELTKRFADGTVAVLFFIFQRRIMNASQGAVKE